MVKGLRELHQRFENIPKKLKRAIEDELEKQAAKLVSQMKSLVPIESGDLRDSIGWTWGKVPKGSLKIGKVYGKEYGKMSITIYAGNRKAFYAVFVEFGTQPHSLATNASVTRGLRQGSGVKHPGAVASPFFYPTYRADKRRIKSAITRRVNKEIKKL